MHYRKLQKLLLCMVVIAQLLVPSASALSAAQHAVLHTGTPGIPYFNTEDETIAVCGDGGSSVPVSTASPSDIQKGNAKIVIGIAKTENLGKPGALIGLMVGLDESGLRDLANTNIPLSESNPNKQGDGSDHSSLGVFQQQIDTNWSTISTDRNNAAAVNQLMDPLYNAEAFFGSPPGSKAPPQLSKGLQNHADWQSKEPWIAAQEVQASADPTGANYHAQLAAAQNLLNLYYDSSPAIPLPIAFTAGAGAAAGSGSVADACATGSTSIAGDEHELATQILANPSISYDYGQGGIVIGALKDLAAGKKANILPNAGDTDVSVTLLKFILTAAKTHKVNISSLTTQHSPGDIHSVGDAVDVNILDLTHLVGRDPGALDLIKIGTQTLPSGSGFGQDGCPGGAATLPAGFIQFADTCNHLHIQVPRGTP
jgi:hypothetical protein